MSEENLELIRAGFAAHNSGDLDALVEVYDPDERLLWMRHEASMPPGPDAAVEEVPYDAVHDLRLAWYQEDFPDQDPGNYHAHARDVSLRRGARVLVVREDRPKELYARLGFRPAWMTMEFLRPP